MSVVRLDIHVLAANGNIMSDETTERVPSYCPVTFSAAQWPFFMRQAWANILRDLPRRFIRCDVLR